MAHVEMYSKLYCPFCHRAKALLTRKGVDVEVIDITFNGAKRQEMLQRAEGRFTVPQIFIDGQGVGGCDELMALERVGKLDPLLGTSQAT
ncbi:MAG: glutaredoxin 3 [Candidatus Competibacterales bacterium]